jgi:pyridoxamine 5'-phosphate oxidase
MRFFDERGPGFVTSRDSTKGVELAAEPRVAASLVWPAMFRSIRFRGVAEEVAAEEVGAYWASRPWGSRISAWASRQSQPATGREQLEASFDRYAAQFPDRGGPDDVPVPEFWSGYRVRCREVEFWAGRRNRLHDRLVFSAVGAGGGAAAQDVDAYPSLDDPTAWTVLRRQP